jgi:hypothetical protein
MKHVMAVTALALAAACAQVPRPPGSPASPPGPPGSPALSGSGPASSGSPPGSPGSLTPSPGSLPAPPGSPLATPGSAQTSSGSIPAAPDAGPSVSGIAPAGGGLSDLEGMTLGCPKAALNAAAREAARAPSQGTYQFAYFQIVSDSHHGSYEVGFKSNYEGEPDLKYCVSMYCQQGWDPKTTKASIRLLADARRPAGSAARPTLSAAHEAACGSEHAPMKRRSRR